MRTLTLGEVKKMAKGTQLINGRAWACTGTNSKVHALNNCAVNLDEIVSTHIYQMGMITAFLSHGIIIMTEKIKIILQFAELYPNIRKEWRDKGKGSVR